MLKYKIVKQKDQINDQDIYRAQLDAVSPVSIEDISKLISEQCTVTEHDVRGVISALEAQIAQALLSGHSVRLGLLGSFRPALKSKTVSREDYFNAADDITGLYPIFRTGTYLRKMLKIGNVTVKAV